MEDHLLTPMEVAEYLQVSLSVVYRMTARGLIPYIRVGGSLRFRTEDIESGLIETAFRANLSKDLSNKFYK